LASKGVVRSGEAYCLACYQLVERSAEKCVSCGEVFESDVKAFFCPKCKTVMALGDPTCPNCGLKFKVKALKGREPAQDDQFLMKLIEWGKGPADEKPATPARPPVVEAEPVVQPPTQDQRQLEKLTVLKESIKDLMANRSEMLERMEKRLEDERARLAKITEASDSSSTPEQVEEEIMSLADEMADITMLQAHMDSLSDEISALMDTVKVSDATKERGLAARALRKQLEAKERELSELQDKEEQLAKREEMVDRKIQSYAQKRRQLDMDEEALKSKLLKLEEDRAELDLLKETAVSGGTESEREEARAEWLEEQKAVRERIRELKSRFEPPAVAGGPDAVDSVEGDIDAMITALEGQIASLITEKVELQKKIADAKQVDEDIRKLLRILDQMLGQLPEDIIERFSKSEDFATYERVLDRFNI